MGGVYKKTVSPGSGYYSNKAKICAENGVTPTAAWATQNDVQDPELNSILDPISETGTTWF